MRTRSLLAASAAATLLLVPTAAQASDNGLQKTVITAENDHLIPAAVAFERSARAVESSPDAALGDLLSKTGDFRHSLTYTKHAVTPLSADTPRYALGKKQYLTALREYDLGLVQYQKLLKSASSTTSKTTRAAVVKKLKTFIKRINAASKDEDAALRLLHIRQAKS